MFDSGHQQHLLLFDDTPVYPPKCSRKPHREQKRVVATKKPARRCQVEDKVEPAFSIVSTGSTRSQGKSPRANFAELYPSVDDGFFPLSIFEKRRREQVSERQPEVSELRGFNLLLATNQPAKPVDRTVFQEEQRAKTAVGSVTNLLSTRPLSRRATADSPSAKDAKTRMTPPTLAQCTDDDRFWTRTPVSNVSSSRRKRDERRDGHEAWMLRPFWSDSLAAAQIIPKRRQQDDYDDKIFLTALASLERRTTPITPQPARDDTDIPARSQQQPEQPQTTARTSEEEEEVVIPRISVRVVTRK